ncbi:MAG: ABC transporter substrate-binding protein [Treponema sp.]|nr:ABC transporter substrate-binding protein [Treponema sp.]
MKRIVILPALLLAAVMVFAGGGGQAAGGGKAAGSQAAPAAAKTKVVFWHAMGGRNQEALNKLITAYNASQDKYTVEGQYQGNYDDAITKLRATPKGSGPDVMQLYDIGTRWAIDSKTTLKMQDFINRDKYDISDYEPNILAYYALDGQLYSMPFNCSSPVIIYNKEALAKAGLDPKTAFATMDACLATGKAMQQKAGLTVGGSMTNYSWVWEQLVGIQDKDLLDNGNGRKGRATQVVGGDALLNIFTKVNTIARDPSNKVFGKGTGESKNQFATGTVGYIADSCSIYVDISAAAAGKFSVGFAPLPKVNSGDTGGVSVGGGSLWLMDNGDKNRTEGAWGFIKFVTGAQQQAEWSIGTGYLPIRKSSLTLPFYQDYINKTNPELMVAIKALQGSKPSCAGSVMGVFSKARVIIENEVEAMYNNPTTVAPQTVVNNIVKQINDEIALYNRTNP